MTAMKVAAGPYGFLAWHLEWLFFPFSQGFLEALSCQQDCRWPACTTTLTNFTSYSVFLPLTGDACILELISLKND